VEREKKNGLVAARTGFSTPYDQRKRRRE